VQREPSFQSRNLGINRRRGRVLYHYFG